LPIDAITGGWCERFGGWQGMVIAAPGMSQTLKKSL
jgi:hypothetical protein